MKPESIVLAVAGAFFGLIVGWVIGSQQAGPSRFASAPAAVAQPAQAAPAQGSMPPAQPPRALDEAQVQALRAAAEKNPSDVKVRVDLGNMYFDAERYSDAVTWYQEALKISPKDADVSTDLGVSFYYMNQPDRALQQFEESLKYDPKHAKTMLNQGIVRAFGKQDLPGAVAVWEKLIQIAPTSAEAETAKRALQGLKSAHPEVGGKSSGTAPGV
ncbi:MAG TPA: tetratricopeptide repeat protein [Vicinamibacterales bacterium]